VVTGSHFSTEILWPRDNAIGTPDWPHLKKFIMEVSNETADGRYYLLTSFERYPPLGITESPGPVSDIGDVPEYELRHRPVLELFTALALVIAQAAQRMPKIKLFSFQIASDYGFHYSAGEGARPSRTDWVFNCPYPQLLGWMPPDDAIRQWKAKCGLKLEESIITYERHSNDGWHRHLVDGQVVKASELHEHFSSDYCLELSSVYKY
jgi:hypothetical protein